MSIFQVAPTLTDPDRPSVAVSNDAAIFNFVTVRPARDLSQQGVVQTLISYQPAYNSAFVAARQAAAAPTTYARLAQDQSQDAAPAALAEVPDATAAAAQLAATMQQLADLQQLGQWLRANRRHLDAATVQQALAERPVAPATPEQLGQVWDGLSRLVASGNTQARHEPLLAVLRAQYFLENYAQAGDRDEALQALAAADVVLPAGVQPPRRRVAPAPVADPAAAAQAEARQQALASQRQQLADLEQALAELRRLRDVRQEAARSLSLVAPADPEAPLTDEQVANARTQQQAEFVGEDAGLAPATTALLAALGAPATLRFSFAVAQLEAQASQLAQQMGQGATTTQVVFQAGGMLWTENPAAKTSAAAARTLTRTTGDFTSSEFTATDFLTDTLEASDDDPYFGFYDDELPGSRIRPLGIGDLNRVEQTLCCYQAGEVAHIENIMQGEYKERATRHLLRTEDTLDQTTESERTTERDTTSTDRFELAQEATKVLQQDSSLSAGVSASGTFGLVTVQASSNFALSSASTETDHQTSNYAKSVTDRSLQRIVEKVRTQRTSKRTEEFEENDKHGFDNRAGKGHVVGLYRWVDKIYKAQVVNYGKRLMFEFMLPEPGSFHLWAMSQAAGEANTDLARLPRDPRTTPLEVGGDKLRGAADLSPTNYLAWAGAYGVSVAPPPPDTTYVSVAYNGSKPNIERFRNAVMAGTIDSLVVPEGYVASSIRVNADFMDDGGDEGVVTTAYLTIGDGRIVFTNRGLEGGYPRGSWQTLYLQPLTGKVPVTYSVLYSERFTTNLVLTCLRTDAALDAWRLKAFEDIIGAYQDQKTAYDQAVAEAKARAGDAGLQTTNAALNQQLITTELKKGCLNWLLLGQAFSQEDVVPGKDDTPPVYHTDAQALADGERAKFLEQCFEWELLSYTLYPYYWAAEGRWRTLYRLSDADPLLLNFLQAGMSRVLVSVRPGYEQAAMYFLKTGRIYNSGELTPLASPIYRSVVDELKLPVGVRVGQPWEIRVPTTLTVLQEKSGAVEGKGLPCACTPSAALGAGTTADVVLAGK